MHVQSHNVAHYTGDYSTKFADTTGTLLGNHVAGIERYEHGVGSVAPPASQAVIGDAVYASVPASIEPPGY